jgi:hypothetical protein
MMVRFIKGEPEPPEKIALSTKGKFKHTDVIHVDSGHSPAGFEEPVNA